MLLDLAARIALLPILIGQALFVRWRIVVLPEPDGPRSGRVGAGPPLRLLIAGDSSAAGVGVGTQQAALLGQLTQALGGTYSVDFRLVAKTGARTAQTRARLQDIKGKHYDVVVTALGVNDVIKGTTLADFVSQQTALLDHIQADLAPVVVVVSSLPPVGDFPALPQPLRWVLGRQTQRFNAALQQLVEARLGCHWLAFDETLDASMMAIDGFHPGPGVYAAWGQKTAAKIRQHLPNA